jgi:hypothetical protein
MKPGLILWSILSFYEYIGIYGDKACPAEADWAKQMENPVYWLKNLLRRLSRDGLLHQTRPADYKYSLSLFCRSCTVCLPDKGGFAGVAFQTKNTHISFIRYIDGCIAHILSTRISGRLNKRPQYVVGNRLSFSPPLFHCI